MVNGAPGDVEDRRACIPFVPRDSLGGRKIRGFIKSRINIQTHTISTTTRTTKSINSGSNSGDMNRNETLHDGTCKLLAHREKSLSEKLVKANQHVTYKMERSASRKPVRCRQKRLHPSVVRLCSRAQPPTPNQGPYVGDRRIRIKPAMGADEKLNSPPPHAP